MNDYFCSTYTLSDFENEIGNSGSVMK